MAGISVAACQRFVEGVARQCAAVPAPAPAPAVQPNWDAVAASLASQSNAIAWGSLVLAVIFGIAGLAWGKIITTTAKQEARDAAEREAKNVAKTCAESYIEKWLADEAPGIIRERVDFILDATLGSGNDANAADDLGEQAG